VLGGETGILTAFWCCCWHHSGTDRCAITITAKSSAEEQYVHNLMHGSVDMLKLPEGATLVAGTEGLLINSDADGFDVLSYMRKLDTLQFGKLLLHAHELPSTQSLLSQNFHAFPVGTVSVADVQNQGKGRGGNKWESPKGCLVFSYTLQMEDARSIPFLQYVVSLAVIEGIEAVCSSKVCSLYSGGRYSTLSHSLSSLQQFWEVDVCNPNHSLLVKS
jgi:biotin--protein ligase